MILVRNFKVLLGCWNKKESTKYHGLQLQWVMEGLNLTHMDQLKNQNRQEMNVYLEFLVLFVHLNPETD